MKKLPIAVFVTVFTLLAVSAWVHRPFNPTNDPRLWKGCPNVMHRVQQPGPTPPAGFFKQFAQTEIQTAEVAASDYQDPSILARAIQRAKERKASE